MFVLVDAGRPSSGYYSVVSLLILLIKGREIRFISFQRPNTIKMESETVLVCDFLLLCFLSI